MSSVLRFDGTFKPSSSPSLEEDEGFSDWTQRREKQRQLRRQELNLGAEEEDDEEYNGNLGHKNQESSQVSITASRLQKQEQERLEMERRKQRQEEAVRAERARRDREREEETERVRRDQAKEEEAERARRGREREEEERKKREEGTKRKEESHRPNIEVILILNPISARTQVFVKTETSNTCVSLVLKHNLIDLNCRL